MSQPQAVRSTFGRSGLLCWVVLMMGFLAYAAFLWPHLFNFVSYAFRDPGSFATLEDLLHENLRLGVDVGYSYGFLGVLFQHGYCLIAGGPAYHLNFLVCAVYLLLMALYWCLLWRDLGSRPAFLVGLFLLSPWLVWYLPVIPYAIVQLSLVFGLLCLLRNQLSTALVFGVIGWLAVPSLPIVFTLFVCAWICFDWYTSPTRTMRSLGRSFVPAVLTGAVLSAVMALVFGWRSFSGSVLPRAGAAMYKALNFGIRGIGSLWLHPHGARITYYLGTAAGWWLLGVCCCFLLALKAAIASWREKKVSPANKVLLTAAGLQAAFIALAFGDGTHTVYYNPIIVTAFMIGAASLSNAIVRTSALIVFASVGLLGLTTTARATMKIRKVSHRYADTGWLYAESDFEKEWKPILSAAHNKNVLILSYGNGVREFYPEVQASDSWFLLPGLVVGPEKQLLLARIRTADVIAEDLQGNRQYLDGDPDIQTALRDFRPTTQGKWFLVRVRQK